MNRKIRIGDIETTAWHLRYMRLKARFLMFKKDIRIIVKFLLAL